MQQFRIEVQAAGLKSARQLPAGAGLVDALHQVEACVAAARRRQGLCRILLAWGREPLLRVTVNGGAAVYMSALKTGENAS